MFKFLKDKLKSAVSKFSKDVEEEIEEKVIPSSKTEKVVEEEIVESTGKEIVVEKVKEEKSKKNSKKEVKILTEEKKKETISETVKETNAEETIVPETDIKTEYPTQKEIKEEPVNGEIERPKKNIEESSSSKTGVKGFFSKITETVTKKKLSETKFDNLFWEIEVALLESNIAVEVIEKIKQDLKDALVDEKHSMFKTEKIIHDTLKKSISDLLDFESVDFNELVKEKKPYVIAFIGVNGSGKTTNLAKLAYKLKNDGFEVVIAACDTFRAAAIQQVEEHANNIGVKLIKHDYGSDAAAVAFDAIEHAKAKGKDFVLIDTAGRNQANTNLMEELKKIIRVTNPDMKIFVGDALTGNDAVEQAKEFNDAVGIDNIILSKVDADEKGGASVSISYVAKKPIIFIGNGQDYKDLEKFNKDEFLEKLGLD